MTEVMQEIVVDERSGSAASVWVYPLFEGPYEASVNYVLVLLRPNDHVEESLDLSIIGKALGLTPRETEICVALLKKPSLKTVASHLKIGHETVKTHLKRIFEKTGVHGQVELVARLHRVAGRRI